MSLPLDDGPYANLVRRAMSDIASNHRSGDAPGWDALGIDADFLGRAGRLALDGDERTVMQRDAVRARIAMLVRSGPDPRVPNLVPAAMREAAARRYVEDAMAIMRVRRAFVDRGPPIRPMLLLAIRHAGLDAAAVCMIVAANRWKADLPVDDGTLAAIPLDTDREGGLPEGATLGEIRVGAPLAPRVRLTTAADMRTWVIVPPLPETVARGLPGRRLRDVVDHPVLPREAAVLEAVRLGDVTANDPHPDDVALLFDAEEGPRTWRGCDPASFGPIRG